MTRASAIPVAVLAVLGYTVHAWQGNRQDGPPPPSFRVGVDAVRIDAVVTDKHGRAVTDLSADDFELRQDGDPQVVTLAQVRPRVSAGVDKE